MYVVETENLTKYYGKSRGIVDVNLQLREGEIFGFIGPNGAGKTTTIRLLLNFIFPTRGRARIFGMDCVEESREIKRQVGYLPGEAGYYGDMRVKDFLGYAESFYGRGCRQRTRDLVEALDLNPDARIEDLSLGNKKKVGIVQALLHSPRLLILDEPTSGLDPLIQKRFFDLLTEENRRGVTIFFSSHVLSEVQKFCHRVGIIKEGRLLRVDQIEALRGQEFKRVTVTLRDPAEELSVPLQGVRDFVRENGTYRFLFNGDVDALIKELARHGVANLYLEEPALEEVFMHYYEKEGER